jgi:hypothetical protein
MSDDIVFEVIKTLCAEAQSARSHAISKGYTHSEHFCEPVPEPAPCAPRVYDTEILAKVQEKIPGSSLSDVNECCVRLIDAEKIKLVNTNSVRVNQNGHIYEIRTPVQATPASFAPVTDAIQSLTRLRKAQDKPLKFVDLEIFELLARGGHNMTIPDVNRVCIALVMMGSLKILGGLDWVNVQAEGMTYEAVS